MLKVGLTGGIACGKSHVLRELGRLGASTIDADEIAHQVILPGQPAYQDILDSFGSGILSGDETIDRRKLGRIVFSDPEARRKLNGIVHPRVLEEENTRISRFQEDPNPGPPLIVVDAALMFEIGSYRRYQFVIVVYCQPSLQLLRLMTRDRLSEEDARKRIDSQMPVLEKARRADYVIDNSGTLEETSQQTRHVFSELVYRHEEDSGSRRGDAAGEWPEKPKDEE